MGIYISPPPPFPPLKVSHLWLLLQVHIIQYLVQIGFVPMGGVKVNQRGQMDVFPAQDVAVEKVRNLLEAVGNLAARRDAEDGVELLQTAALGLGQQDQHQEPADQVPRRVPPKGALRLEGLEQARPRHRQHKVEEPRRRRRQRHAVGAQIQWVGFGRVRERDGPFARRVHDAEEVDAEGYAGDATFAVLRDPKGEAGEEEEDGHEWESKEEEVAAAESVAVLWSCVVSFERV